LVAAYVWQGTAPDQEELFLRYGLITLQDQGWTRLITSLFLHQGWGHVGMNAAFALAFGAALSRLFGTHLLGAFAFFAFFLVCGAFAGWAYVSWKPGPVVLIGASGGVSGLFGAASRLLDRGRDPAVPLAPFLSAPVVSVAVAFIIMNLVVAVFGFPVFGGQVAWEAHLFGYAAGLFLVGPVFWLLRGERSRIDSRG
jgi:membrane associated rhomboid family serine protease